MARWLARTVWLVTLMVVSACGASSDEGAIVIDDQTRDTFSSTCPEGKAPTYAVSVLVLTDEQSAWQAWEALYDLRLGSEKYYAKNPQVFVDAHGYYHVTYSSGLSAETARRVYGVLRINDFGTEIGDDGLYINPLVLGWCVTSDPS